MTIRSAHTIPEDRSLTAEERELLQWLFSHSTAVKCPEFEKQISALRVIAKCSCGCPSVDFSVDGRAPVHPGMRGVTDEFFWLSREGHIHAVQAYEKDGQLAGLEIYSIDGLSTPPFPDLRILQTDIHTLRSE